LLKNKEKKTMNIYWKRRLWLLLVLALTIGFVDEILVPTVTGKVMPAVAEYFDNDWSCKQLVAVTVQKDTSLSEIAEGQIVNGNCQGYEGLLEYLTDRYEITIYPGEMISITSYGDGN
jgi:hypothetical protein